MTPSLGITLPHRPSARRGTVPVTVAVGHRSSFVSAGLGAILTRTPGCDIRLSDVPANTCDGECPRTPQLIFGDSTVLNRLRECSGVPTACARAEAKLVWITAGDEERARAAKAAGDIDEHVPLECPEEELFAVVRRLIGFGDDASVDAARARAKFHGGLAPGAFRRVRAYIDEHLTERIPTHALARIAGLSLGHFGRAFKQTTGIPPHRYITQKRVAMATDLLCNTVRALADIALDVGFADQSHFSRTYLAVTGENPSACRRRHR